MLAPTVLADHEAVSTAAAVSIAARLESKPHALRRLTQGPITARFPASFLHLHPEVTLLVDAAAAGRTH